MSDSTLGGSPYVGGSDLSAALSEWKNKDTGDLADVNNTLIGFNLFVSIVCVLIIFLMLIPVVMQMGKSIGVDVDLDAGWAADMRDGLLPLLVLILSADAAFDLYGYARDTKVSVGTRAWTKGILGAFGLYSGIAGTMMQ